MRSLEFILEDLIAAQDAGDAPRLAQFHTELGEYLLHTENPRAACDYMKQRFLARIEHALEVQDAVKKPV